MRAVIRKDNIKIEFSGRGQIWNDLLRPYLGGPEAPAEPLAPAMIPQAAPSPASAPQTPRPTAPVAQFGSSHPGNGSPAPSAPRTVFVNPVANRPQAPAQPRTWYPPRAQPVQRVVETERAASHYSTEEEDGGPEAVRVEPSSDPATLYSRLGALEGRRSERDAVLAAVWFLTKGERETTGDEVEAHLASFRAFGEVKVVPHLLKHIHRTKLLDAGTNSKAVRLSKKGLGYVRGRLVGD